MSKALCNKNVFTTGEVAQICSVAPRTVSKWFDSGKLEGYNIPGSRDRRIPRKSLIAFMKLHKMPLSGLTGDAVSILIIAQHAEFFEIQQGLLEETYHFAITIITNLFEAGKLLQKFRYRVVVLDENMAIDVLSGIVSSIRSDLDLALTKVFLLRNESTNGAHSPLGGIDRILNTTTRVQEFVEIIREVTQTETY